MSFIYKQNAGKIQQLANLIRAGSWAGRQIVRFSLLAALASTTERSPCLVWAVRGWPVILASINFIEIDLHFALWRNRSVK